MEIAQALPRADPSRGGPHCGGETARDTQIGLALAGQTTVQLGREAKRLWDLAQGARCGEPTANRRNVCVSSQQEKLDAQCFKKAV